MKILKYLFILILILNFSCRKKEFENPLNDWLQDPPVSPITQTIKTVVPIGYAASLVIHHMKGYDVPHTKTLKQKGINVLSVNTETDYPYHFKNDVYGQMIVAYIKTDENTALVSVFFTDMDVVSGNFKLLNAVAFPVTFDEFNQKITAVYASMDINLDLNLTSDSDYGLDLSLAEIEENLFKLENERADKYGTEIAIAQNAWIIDIYHQGTFNDLTDDEFKIYGGQQTVAVEDYNTESSVGAMQMAMIDVSFSSDCLYNPTEGYVFMQDVEVASSPNDNDIVFGHVFYEFTPDCDGRVLIDIATGNFILSMGKELDLGLN